MQPPKWERFFFLSYRLWSFTESKPRNQLTNVLIKTFGSRYNTLRCNDMLPPPSAIYICNEINKCVVAWWLKHGWFPVVCDFKTLCVALWEWNFPLELSWWSGFDRSICPPCFGGTRRSHNHDSLAPVIIGLVYANLTSSNNQGQTQDFKLGGGYRISSSSAEGRVGDKYISNQLWRVSLCDGRPIGSPDGKHETWTLSY